MSDISLCPALFVNVIMNFSLGEELPKKKPTKHRTFLEEFEF